MFTLQEYHDQIGSKLSALDVAILVLNAGIGECGSVHRFRESHIQDLCTINVLHVMYLAKIMAKQLSERLEKVGQKSALIVTSSILATKPVPGVHFYGATKSLESFIAQGLHWEFKGKVDSISFEPSYVSSAMNHKNIGGRLLISSDEAARSCLAQLGYTPFTSGNWKHEAQAWMLRNLPNTAGVNAGIFKDCCDEQLKNEEESKNKK